MNPTQRQQLLSEDWTFDTSGILKKLVVQYPQDQFKFYVLLGNEMSSPVDGGKSSLFPVLHVIISPTDLEELPPFFRRKAYMKREAQVLDFDFLQLKWELTEEFCMGVPVYALRCSRSLEQIAGLQTDLRFNYEYAFLMDCRPSKAFPPNRKGLIAVNDVSFQFKLPNGSEITEYFWDVQSRSDFIDDFIEEKGLENDMKTRASVDDAIVEAAAKKRKNAEHERETVLENVRDPSLLERVKCAKIFPWKMASAIGLKTPHTEHSYGWCFELAPQHLLTRHHYFAKHTTCVKKT